ncbi:MAG: methionine ABC transporter permease [Christensenellales bacterium]|jgi:D-methionine transport system permease protein
MLTASFWLQIGNGLLETLYMTLVSSLLSYIIGLPLGVLLVVTDKNGLVPRPTLNKVLNVVVNLCRSIPFLILMIAVTPLSRFLLGTTLGSTATIVPLVIGASPFIGRVVESSLREVGSGVVEAAVSMGASPWQIITKVLLPEALPSLIVGAALSVTTILGYSALAGMLGGGGLGALAINYGYYRYMLDYMYVPLVVLVVVVQIFQLVGDAIARAVDKRK